MAAYISTATLKTALAQILQKADESKLAVGVQTLQNAVDFAYNEIIDRMTRRGFTKGQVDQWDRRVEFNTQIALWHCFAAGGVPANGDDKWVKNYDVRKDLDTVGLYVGGVKVWPGAATNDDPGGSVGGGMLGGSSIVKPYW